MDIAKFEVIMNEAMRSTPQLVLFVDPFQLMRIAKEDVKLSELLFRQGQKKMLVYQQEQAAANQQQTIQGQIDSAKAAEEEKRTTKEMEMEVEVKKAQAISEASNKGKVLDWVTAMIKPQTEGGKPSIPNEYLPLVNAVIDNIMLSTVTSTEEQKNQILMQMQAAREQDAMQQQQMMQQQTNQQPPAMA